MSFFNSGFWNKLPQVYRDIMNEAFAEIPQEEWAESISNEAYFIGKLEEKGVTVSELSDSTVNLSTKHL
jgi:TRAP-type C4-dicarboxylate transport system substrate-binding protein